MTKGAEDDESPKLKIGGEDACQGDSGGPLIRFVSFIRFNGLSYSWSLTLDLLACIVHVKLPQHVLGSLYFKLKLAS